MSDRGDYQRTASKRAGYRSQLANPLDPTRKLNVVASSLAELRERVAFVRELRRDMQIGRRTAEEVAKLLAPKAAAPRVLVSSVWATWAHGLARSSREKAASVWKCHFKAYHLAYADALTEEECRRWEAWMQSKGRATSTIVSSFELMQAAYRLAVRCGRVELVPFEPWRPSRDRRGHEASAREALRSPEEFDRLVSVALAKDGEKWERGAWSDLGYRVIVMTLCGLRNGEASGLGWDDVDLEAGTLTVRHQALDGWKDGSAARPLDPPKGRTARTIALHPDASEALAAQRLQLAAHDLYREDGPVFPGIKGRWRAGADCILSAELRTLVVAAGLPHPERWVTHSLRHSAATLESAAGSDLRSIQARTGHSSLRMLEPYVHASKRGLPPSAIRRLNLKTPLLPTT